MRLSKTEKHLMSNDLISSTLDKLDKIEAELKWVVKHDGGQQAIEAKMLLRELKAAMDRFLTEISEDDE